MAKPENKLRETNGGRSGFVCRAKLILGHHLLCGERRLLAQQLADGLDLLPLLGIHLVDGHLSNLHEEEDEEEEMVGVGVEEGV